MRAFIPCKDGIPLNTNFYAAWLGFKDAGFEIVDYFSKSTLGDVEREDVVVGGIGSCHFVMNRLGVVPPIINYPDSFKGYLGREIWGSTINQVRNDDGLWPIL